MTTQNIFDLSDTWNDGATTFKGIGLNVTDTASASGSLLMDLQVGGVSKFNVNKLGALGLGDNGSQSAPSIGRGSTGLYFTGANGLLLFAVGGTYQASVQTGIFSLRQAMALGWESGGAASSVDLSLNRDAADTLAQRRSTNPQAFRAYNTFTDASNYERGKIAWESNVLRIGTEKAGTGSARALELQTDGVTRLTLAANSSAVTGGVFIATAYFVTPPAALNGNGGIYFGAASTNRAELQATGVGILTLGRWGAGDVTLQFGGTTSSFPALKRSTTALQVRLADDSAFTNVQGKITTETAYTAGAPTATGYIVLYDSTGTAYKVPAEAL